MRIAVIILLMPLNLGKIHILFLKLPMN